MDETKFEVYVSTDHDPDAVVHIEPVMFYSLEPGATPIHAWKHTTPERAAAYREFMKNYEPGGC